MAPRGMEGEQFKQLVESYVVLHDEISASTRQLGELKKRREVLGEAILEFMRSRGIDQCDLQEHGGKLIRRESKRTEGLKKDHILPVLLGLTGGDAARARASLDEMNVRRGVEVKDVLSRTKK